MFRAQFFLSCFVLPPLLAGQSMPGTAAGNLPASLTLEQAEELLLNRSLPLLAAKTQVDIAEAARQIAGLRANPVVQLGAEQLPFYSNVPGSVPNFYKTTQAAAMPTYGVEVGQLFERGAKRQLRSEQADAALEAKKTQALDVLRDEVLRLRQAFTSALLAKANLKLVEETDRQYAETERLMTVRLRGGEIAEVDLDRVKAARLPFFQAVLEAKLAYSQATREVAALLGTTQRSQGGKIPDLQGDLETEFPVPALETLRTLAAAERPDLSSARAELRAAERGTRLAEAQRKRDVYGSLLMQRTGQDYAVGASVSFPLFVFNNQRAAIAQASASERLASTLVRQTTLEVESDVEKAYETALSAKQAVELFSNEAIERSRSIRSIITYSYQRGEADLLEVLDAQRSANQILTGYNLARANYLNSIWQLQYAVGRSF
jgi:cobalt-zinc-cadmium efflux system outer membrane protein